MNTRACAYTQLVSSVLWKSQRFVGLRVKRDTRLAFFAPTAACNDFNAVVRSRLPPPPLMPTATSKITRRAIK